MVSYTFWNWTRLYCSMSLQFCLVKSQLIPNTPSRPAITRLNWCHLYRNPNYKWILGALQMGRERRPLLAQRAMPQSSFKGSNSLDVLGVMSGREWWTIQVTIQVKSNSKHEELFLLPATGGKFTPLHDAYFSSGWQRSLKLSAPFFSSVTQGSSSSSPSC